MTSRGRGIRSRRVEAPRPRRSISATFAVDGTLEVERVLLDKMMGRLVEGALSPSEASSLNLTLKNSGESLEKADKVYMNQVLDTLRSCLKTTVLSPTCRLYLLEVLELAARSWETNKDVDRYYEKKFKEFNIRQRLVRELGGESVLLGGSSGCINSEKPSSKLCSSKFHSERDRPFSQHSEGSRLLCSGLYDYGKSVQAMDIYIKEEDVGAVLGKNGSNVTQIQKLSDTRVSVSKKEHSGANGRKTTVTGPGETSIMKAISLIEGLLETGEVSNMYISGKTAQVNGLSHRASLSSIISDKGTRTDYETASEGDVFMDEPTTIPDTSMEFGFRRQLSEYSPGSQPSLSSPGYKRQMSEPSPGMFSGHSTSSADDHSLFISGSRKASENSAVTSDSVSPQCNNYNETGGSTKEVTHTKQVYTIPVGKDMLRLSCANKLLLKEAVQVLSSHFCKKSSSSSEEVAVLADQEGSTALDDQNNNKHTDPSRHPLPDADDDIWNDKDDMFLLSEIQNVTSVNLEQEDPKQQSAVDLEAEEKRLITSTPAPPNELTTEACEISDITNPLHQATTCLRSYSEPSIDLEGLVRQELEGTTHVYNQSSISCPERSLSEASLSKSSLSSLDGHISIRIDRYGFSQPMNVWHFPLNPLASQREIRQAEDPDCHPLGPSARRKYFEKTSRCYHRRMNLSEIKGQKVLQYGQNFLLACAKSPLSKQRPSEWLGRSYLPDVCLTYRRNTFFNPDIFDSSVVCSPVLYAGH